MNISKDGELRITRQRIRDLENELKNIRKESKKWRAKYNNECKKNEMFKISSLFGNLKLKS